VSRKLRAVLFDVGGTLVRDDAPELGTGADGHQRARLRESFGEDLPWFENVVAAKLESEDWQGVAHRQDTRAAIRELLAEVGVRISEADAERIRAACCLPGPAVEQPRPGALEALWYAKRLGLRVALVTNVLWRTGADSMRDWIERGTGDCIDAHVTSIDVGWRKPHSAMFERAHRELGVDASEAAMVGNSRAADIAPAKRLGMRAVLVRSLDRSASDVEPDEVIDELTELPEILDRWVKQGLPALAHE
jgi:FMN phosphatase YigB (HAD superfamily)